MTSRNIVTYCIRIDVNENGTLDAEGLRQFADAFGDEYQDAILTSLDADGKDPLEVAGFMFGETESDSEDDEDGASPERTAQKTLPSTQQPRRSDVGTRKARPRSKTTSSPQSTRMKSVARAARGGARFAGT